LRVRTVLTWATGAAMGAAAMYLMDPEHGPARRADARREALRQARSGAVVATQEARRRAEEMAVAALAGYRDAREQTAPSRVTG
jgi:hypothetical protein